MIYINGAPGTGKTTLARLLAHDARIIHTDDYLAYSHEDQLKHIWDDMHSLPARLVEGCAVDRLVKHGFYTTDTLLLCTGFQAQRPKCEALAARAKKYYEMYPGPKAMVDFKPYPKNRYPLK